MPWIHSCSFALDGLQTADFAEGILIGERRNCCARWEFQDRKLPKPKELLTLNISTRLQYRFVDPLPIDFLPNDVWQASSLGLSVGQRSGERHALMDLKTKETSWLRTATAGILWWKYQVWIFCWTQTGVVGVERWLRGSVVLSRFDSQLLVIQSETKLVPSFPLLLGAWKSSTLLG